MPKDIFLEELLRIVGIDPSKVADLHWVEYPNTIGYTIILDNPVKFLKIGLHVG